MKDPAWIAALFAVLGLFLGIGWLFLAMIAVFVALIAAGSIDNAPAHGHGHGHDSHGHDSHGHGSHGHDSHASHAVHAEPKPIGGFLDVMLGNLLSYKKIRTWEDARRKTKADEDEKIFSKRHDAFQEKLRKDPIPVVVKQEHPPSVEKDESDSYKKIIYGYDGDKSDSRDIVFGHKKQAKKEGSSDHHGEHDDHGGHGHDDHGHH